MHKTEIPQLSPLAEAQERLKKALMSQPIDITQVAAGAYINSALQSARIDALQELFLNPEPENASWSRKEQLEAAIARALNVKSEQVESHAQRVQIAQKTPPLHLVG